MTVTVQTAMTDSDSRRRQHQQSPSMKQDLTYTRGADGVTACVWGLANTAPPEALYQGRRSFNRIKSGRGELRVTKLLHQEAPEAQPQMV